jgi:hypothetical protein
MFCLNIYICIYIYVYPLNIQKRKKNEKKISHSNTIFKKKKKTKGSLERYMAPPPVFVDIHNVMEHSIIVTEAAMAPTV